MGSEQEIKKTILKILKPSEKSTIYGYAVFWIGLFTGVGLCFLDYIGNNNVDYPSLGMLTVGVTFFVTFKIISTARRRAYKSYCNVFLPNSIERSMADNILASFKSTKAKDALREKLGVKSEKEIHLEEEAEKARRRAEHMQEAHTITDAFRCGSCDSYVDWMQGAKKHVCSHCKARLLLPSDIACPSCGSLSMKIISRPRSKGKLAGELIYGPVGLVAGGVIDGVKDGLEQAVRRKVRNPIFCCEKCETLWAIKLPVETEEN